jgi:hypothetical protein
MVRSNSIGRYDFGIVKKKKTEKRKVEIDTRSFNKIYREFECSSNGVINVLNFVLK